MHRAPIFSLCWRNRTSVLIEGEKKLHSFTNSLVWSFSSRQFHLSPPVVNEFYDENQFAVSTQIKIDNHRDSSARSSVVHNIWKVHVSLCHNRIRTMIIKFIWFPLRLITNNTRLFRLHKQTKVAPPFVVDDVFLALFLPLFPATIPVDDDSTFLLDAINTSNNVSIKCDNMFA